MPDPGSPHGAERHFAANLRATREDRGLSQAELARRMAEKGWPWHQQTVGRVEAAQRVVRLGEAKDLASILETTVDALGEPTTENGIVRALLGASTAARKAWQQQAEGTLALQGALAELRQRIQAARPLASTSDRLDTALGVAEDTLLMASPDTVTGREREDVRDESH
jgi:transcriptional regulator with XRE-family HTH domain